MAHLGGIITGLTFGTCIIRNFNVQNWEETVKYVCWLIFILFGGALFLCQFKTFEVMYITVLEGSDIVVPRLSAGGWWSSLWDSIDWDIFWTYVWRWTSRGWKKIWSKKKRRRG